MTCFLMRDNNQRDAGEQKRDQSSPSGEHGRKTQKNNQVNKPRVTAEIVSRKAIDCPDYKEGEQVFGEHEFRG